MSINLKRFCTVLLVIGIFFCAAVYGEEINVFTGSVVETPTHDSFKNALGFFGTTVGMASGSYGLHYQRWFDRFGVQFTGGGYYNPSSSWPLDYSANATFLWSVYGQDYSRWLGGRLFLWTMIGHHGRMEPSFGEYATVVSQTYVPTAFAGLGIGIETILFEHFSFPVQFGYSGEFPFKPSLGFSIGGGLRYRY